MASIDILDPFTRIHPGNFISKHSDWIIFTLLLFFFWAVVGIALRKRFQDSKHLRVLVTSTALMLAVGTYYSIYRGWLHLSLEGFGMFGAVLIFIIIFFIIFGLMRGYGIKVSNALPLGFALFYVSLWAVSPNILHTISDIFPPLNLILLVLFIVSVVKILSAFFRHSTSPLDATKELSKTHFTTTDDVEIDKELKEDKKESKFLKRKTMRLTKLDIRTIEDIEGCLKHMISVIKDKGNTIDQGEIAELTQALREITQKESILKRGVELIRRHLIAYKQIHRKDIPELEKRFAEATDRKTQNVIQEQITYQKRMLQALEFMQRYAPKIEEFTKSLNRLVFMAMEKIKSAYPGDALKYLEYACRDMEQMKTAYEKQKDLEKYLLKINKKTIKDLKKEKDR